MLLAVWTNSLFFEDRPINFYFSEKPPSQDLRPVHSMTSGFVWRNKTLVAYRKNGYANLWKIRIDWTIVYGNNDIDEDEDFKLAEQYLSIRENSVTEKSYHPRVEELPVKVYPLRIRSGYQEN